MPKKKKRNFEMQEYLNFRQKSFFYINISYIPFYSFFNYKRFYRLKKWLFTSFLQKSKKIILKLIFIINFKV